MSDLATDRTEKSLPMRPGMSALADDFDGYILDLWGVLHDGVQAYPHALDCLAQLRAAGKRILILSNAPRRASEVAGRCTEMGLTPDTYDLLMSSGEDAWRHLEGRPDDWYRGLGTRCYHLGPERDLGMRDGLDYRFVDDLDEADFILNTGALGQADTRETYTAPLEAALALELPMICANPDHMVERGSSLIYCAGALAHAYEALGGEVIYAGKPHAAIYDLALQLAAEARGAPIPAKHVLAIGDGLATDMAGAMAAKIDALFVASAVHVEGHNSGAELEAATVTALFEGHEAQPIAALSVLKW